MKMACHNAQSNLIKSIILITIFSLTLLIAYFASNFSVEEKDKSETKNNYGNSKRSVTGQEEMNNNQQFNLSSDDVIVFLHIQKTGGTYFGKNMVRNLDVPKKCTKIHKTKRNLCLRPNSDHEVWIFSRYSTGL